ncbi:MAG TPA: TonB-dependent receptor [Gemmatimonadaceae bacterium]|nr:TonB-dependent receptor [Gemmatimonadaceae bacterium]
MNRRPRATSAHSSRWAGKVLLAAALPSAAPLVAQRQPSALDTVTIVASRTHTADGARSVQVVTREEIDRSPARNVADVLSSAMGVDVYARSAAQADVSIRGSSSEQVVVLVDGIRVSDVQSAHYTLDLAVPLASVERIEILRGVGSALYGPDAVGGVINIVTRRSQSSDVRARSGSFGSVGGGLATGMTRDAFTLATAADFDKSDGHRDGTDYRIGQGRVSVSSPTPGGIVRTSLALGVRDFGAADFYAPYNSIERTATTTLDSRWDETIGTWTVGLAGSTRRHQDHYVLVRGNPALYENRHESWQSAASLVGTRTAGPVALAVGTEGVHDQLSSARLGGRREWRGALFGEVTAGVPTRLTVHAGARGDHSSVYGDFFSPSVSVGASLATRLHVHASGGAGFRAPTWTERFYTDPSNRGDPNLRPERFWTGDLGVRASAGAWGLDVTGFTRRATNLIDWVKPAGASASVPWQTMNVGEATYHGLEMALDLPAASGVRASLFADGISLDASQGETLVGKYALRPVTRQVGARITSPPDRALMAQIDVTLARRALEDSYATGNARVAWRRGAYRLTLDLQNLANAVWLDASGKPAAGRGIYGGVEWMR